MLECMKSGGLSFCRKVLPLLALGVWLVPSALRAETPDPDRLAQTFQATLEQIVAKSGAPGGVAAFVLDDGTMRKVAAGFADRERGLPMTPNSRMLTGSVGKTFVGALALSLAADGVLDLDGLISAQLGDKPWFSHLPNGPDITLRHLLTHSSGLVDHVYLPAFAELVAGSNTNPAREDLIALVLDREPLFAVGESFSYTDTGYLLAGMVIEAATGRTYYGELRRRLLDPLGLTLTTPSDHPRLPGLVPGYLPPENMLGLPPKTLDEAGGMVFNPAGEWTGGGLVSNSGDLARWAKTLYEGKAMATDYLPALLESGFRDDDWKGRVYGLGVGIRDTPHGRAYGHSGWFPGYRSFMGYFADYGVAVAVQFNSIEGDGSENDPLAMAQEQLPAVILGAVEPRGKDSDK